MTSFSRFLESIPDIATFPLPGEEAHRKLAPPERTEIIQNLNFHILQPNRAAVMMLIYPRVNKSTIALIKRNNYSGVHASQIALPGGKLDQSESPKNAALRETHEEIGIPQEHITVVREFSELYIPPSNFLVNPFLGFVKETPAFLLNTREVAQVIEMPLIDLLNDAHLQNPVIDTSYSKSVNVPAIVVNEHVIWGATAMILSELKHVLKQVL
jgi:8-oxo-dGTP pyrophosphatase MutT (NUDIX family)